MNFNIGDVLNFGGVKYELVVITSNTFQVDHIKVILEKTKLYLRNVENSNTVCLDESEVMEHIKTWNKN